MKKISVLIILWFAASSFAQINDTVKRISSAKDTIISKRGQSNLNDSLKIFHTTIDDYKFYTENNLAPIVFDTVLSIESLYNQNFTQKDQFGKMYYPNFGETFNPLVYEADPSKIQLLPKGKSFNYMYANQVRYYDVKTPTTEFIYENGVREGQYLSTLFTHSPIKQFNYSVRYRGLRSIGRYLNSVSANSSLILGANYRSKNNRLKLWSHFQTQNIDNEENAGIKDLDLFVNDNENNTTNRQNIPVNLLNTDTEFESRRFRLGASYGLFTAKDSAQIKSPLQLKNIFTYEKQKYLHRENAAESYYSSPVFQDMGRGNQKNFETLSNQSTVEFNWGNKLLLEAGIKYENIKLYANSALIQDLTSVPKRLDDNLFGGVGKLYFDWNEKLKLEANAAFSSGDFFKNQYKIKSTLSLQPLKGYNIKGGFLVQSSYPNLNLLYNQSFYKEFNYYNQSFKNTNTQQLFGEINLSSFNTVIEGSLYNVNNLVYVDEDYRPKQLNGSVNLFQLKANNLVKYKKFNLRTTVQYQKVTQNQNYLPLPDLIARVTLYWESPMFDNAAFVQVGFNANYFTAFQSREFFPVINEFKLQDSSTTVQKIGNFPLIDFFLNIKVQRMRIYLRADHFDSFFLPNNYFSAPNVPFRDFKIQIGIKWYLFT